jgi:hypothetical protein
VRRADSSVEDGADVAKRVSFEYLEGGVHRIKELFEPLCADKASGVLAIDAFKFGPKHICTHRNGFASWNSRGGKIQSGKS